jgi:FKBP-type peptidyl-prolyl cis-trans isomerase
MILALVFGFALSQEETPISLTDDGHVQKVIIRDGSGPSPDTNQQATIKYVGHLPDGSVFDQSQGAFQFTLGRGVIPGWSVGVASMKVGEIAKFSIGYDYGYGERGYPPIVPGRSELTYEIELLNVR